MSVGCEVVLTSCRRLAGNREGNGGVHVGVGGGGGLYQIGHLAQL